MSGGLIHRISQFTTSGEQLQKQMDLMFIYSDETEKNQKVQNIQKTFNTDNIVSGKSSTLLELKILQADYYTYMNIMQCLGR